MIFHKILLIIIFLFISSCSASKINKIHGTVGIEDKYDLLKLNENNSNDIISLLGPPSTKSKFDENLWIYIERKQTQSSVRNLGKMKIFKNDVLVLEMDKFGILKKKEFYNKDDMENIKVVEATTKAGFKKSSFVYEFLSSMRQKINDPLNKRAENRKTISQR